MSSTINQNLPVAIIGGGPVGLAAAAHLIKRNQPFVLFEAGDSVAANMRSWAHVRIFSPWEMNIDDAARELLDKHGWQAPNLEAAPTGGQMIDHYLEPLAALPEIAPHIHLNSRVISVGRKGADKMKTGQRNENPFVVHINQAGAYTQMEARAIIDATGTWQNPNPIGAGGIFAWGEAEASANIFYGIPDILGKDYQRYANKRVAVVGSGHSAINALLDLTTLQREADDTQILWILRTENLQAVYGGESADELPERGALGYHIRQVVETGKISVISPFYIHEIRQHNGHIDIVGMLEDKNHSLSEIDEIIAATGSRPDLDILRELRVTVDPITESVPALASLIDPNIHSCGSVPPHGEQELRQPEKDVYVVGMKSYGRAPTFLMKTGYEQVRSVVAALVGDWEAARRVELVLPETGACCTTSASGQASCCEPTAQLAVETIPLISIQSSNV